MSTEQLKSFFDEFGFKRTIEIIYKEIQELFLENKFPWVIGYSGGKDSTAILQLIWLALERLPIAQRMSKKVYVITTDTLVENPVVARWVTRSLELMQTKAQQASMPIEPHSLKPKYKNSFWVNLLGKGYPAPRAKFRWCTERLKIWPSNEFILNIASKSGETILALGTRKAESSTRARTMLQHEKKRSRDRLSPNSHIPNCLIYTPIEDWTNDDVWLFLTRTENPWGLGNTELLELYKDATEDRECPLVVNLDETTPSCGASRFGCWTCTLVSRDRSLEAMVRNGLRNTWLAPLVEFRGLLGTKDDDQKRDFRRMKGNVQLFHNGPIHGPYLQSHREFLLEQLLIAERKLQCTAPEDYKDIKLITYEELQEIRRIWVVEKHEIEDRLPRIYEKVKEAPYPDASNGFYHFFGEEELQILDDICRNDRLSYEMIRELIDVEWDYRTKLRRAGIFDRLEQAIQRSYYEDKDDAVCFAAGLEQIASHNRGNNSDS